MKLRITLAGVIALIVLHAHVHASPPRYMITDLGTLGGSNSFGIGINASGQITGYSYIADNHDFHVFLYNGATMSDIDNSGGNYSEGHGINASGQVTGKFYTMGNAVQRAFLSNGASVTDLGTLPGGYDSQGWGINDSGQVAGVSEFTGGSTHAVRWTGTTPTDLGTLGGSGSSGIGINDFGQVTGWASLTGDTVAHAFLHSGTSMLDLGTLGGPSSIGYGVNASGAVTGYSRTTSSSGIGHAFLYSSATMTDLGTLCGANSSGYGINASGQVAGNSDIISGTVPHAFLYTGGTMYDLNDLVVPSSGITDIALGAQGNPSAYGNPINDFGQIAAYGKIGGNYHALLLSPDTDGDSIPDRFETGTGIYVSPTDTGTSPTNPDTDGDGLPDGQEVNTYHSNPNVKDTDGDGFDDGFEVSTGFSPTSAASTPDALSSIRTAAEYRFNAANGISYRIEASTDFTNWTTIETNIIGAGGVITRFYSIEGQPKRFFRSRRN